MDVKLKASWPIWLAGLLFVLYGIFFPFYRLTDILIAAGVSLAVFTAADRFAGVKTVHVDAAESFAKTGEESADAVLAAGAANIERLKAVRPRVSGAGLAKEIDLWLEISRRVFSFVSQNPGGSRRLNQFMDYYYPQAIKLVSAYADCEAEPVKTPKIEETMALIEKAAPSITAVFQNLLDSLYADQALDIKTDIEVLESIMPKTGGFE